MTAGQTQSVREFISGQLKQKLGLKVRSVKARRKARLLNQTVINDTTRIGEAKRLLLF
jgi:hypothetical protein